ncbi:unnamed protein product [Peronospora farinosa]|uniref:Mediator complex subunit 15 KIX domain-containing protein n=1 Tax=Peronospora farinosa TaxID=134698 RepID=A0AAV0UM21_9STRA|nr:unnamed protein product [Peronospora farinosa]CAI5737924.1 unnamed protein product [Peronospora farinosa]
MRSKTVNAQEEAAKNRASSAVADVVVSCVPNTTGAESPATPMEVAMATHSATSVDICGLEELEQKPRNLQEQLQKNERMTSSEVTHVQNEQRRERHWRRMVHSELRDRLVAAMMEQLLRITGDPDNRHLRMCASRYESFVWKKSANQVQYKQKLEHRIESLRRQPSHGENGAVEVTVRLVEGHRLNLIRSPNLLLQRQPAATASVPLLVPCPYSGRQIQQVDAGCPLTEAPQQQSSRSSTHRSSSSSSIKRTGKRKIRESLAFSVTDASFAQRDEMYFAKLRVMKNQYRDEVALVFRELCRVNTVIQHSANLRRHESNNLGDFLANLKKIIYLLEQQPGEPCGMIPVRKRAVEYLDVVESHIQRKVLPILYRLRHTYSTILRPIVLNYMKNNLRFNRRF